MPEFLDLKEAIEKYVGNGKKIALEGFTHLIPYAAAHEIIRQKISDLTLVRMTPDIIYDQMIGMGLVKKIIFSYAGNPGVGLLRRMRDAVENDFPRAIELEEHSHAAMANAYEAGASGLPFAVFRGYRGVDLPLHNPNIKFIQCPFTKEKLAAVPAMKLDVAIIHAQKADRKGNVLIEGITGIQKEAVLCADISIVTVEESVDSLHHSPNACVIPGWVITAICEVPGGSHPSYAQGYYERDNLYYIDWDKIAKDREIFEQWMQDNVLTQDTEIFSRRIQDLKK